MILSAARRSVPMRHLLTVAAGLSVTLACLDASTNLIQQLGGMPSDPSGTAPPTGG
jgi:hypothetical protein